MICGSTIRNLVNDLLNNDDYSLDGLAHYSGHPKEVICDIAAGINENPTLALSAKIIELHVLARRHFYDEIMKKILDKFNARKD